MTRHTRIVEALIFVAMLSVLHNKAEAKTTQSEDVEMRGFGHVRITAEEPENGWLNLKFKNVDTGRLLATIFADKSDNSFRAGNLGSIRFRVLHVAGLPDPLILGIAKAQGASDCAYQTIPIGFVHGKIRVLSSHVLNFATQGGIYLGSVNGSVALALWYFDSTDDVEHYGPHKYRFQFFRWNPKTGLLQLSRATTSRRYDSEREAAKSFGLSAEGIIDSTTISSWFPELGC